MNILGIYPGGVIGHDSGAALIKDGKLIAAAEEERFTRVKHATTPPANAVKFCLEHAGLSLEDIDFIAVPWSPYLWFKSSKLSSLEKIAHFGVTATFYFLQKMFRRSEKKVSEIGEVKKRERTQKKSGFLDRFWYNTYVAPTLTRRFDDVSAKIRYYEHHLAHAAGAFYCSGFKNSSILTVDGQGELNSTVMWLGDDNSIKKIREESAENSLGYFYQDVTDYLNLGWWGAGKTMGLAPYGKKNEDIMKKIEKHLDLSGQFYKRKTIGLRSDILGFPPRGDTNILTENYSNLAFAAQDALERTLLKCGEYLVQRTNVRELCMGGGVALNCTANSKIVNSGVINDIFIFPACHDGGVSVGAALECATQLGEKVKFRLDHVYYGPEFSDDEIESVLKKNKIKYEKHGDIAGIAAELLAKGKIVGFFQGRMELGPRALGNRSILADTRKKETWGIVNKVKGREPWRPLAPSILDEAKEEYFENARESPFMLFTFEVKEKKRKEVPAIVHVDGTTRPQTVKKEINEPYYRCIKEFENITGIPLILNTSFNVTKEPIVCTPIDAIRTFYSSSLDCLAIGSFLLRKDY